MKNFPWRIALACGLAAATFATGVFAQQAPPPVPPPILVRPITPPAPAARGAVPQVPAAPPAAAPGPAPAKAPTLVVKPPQAAPPQQPPEALRWDADSKEYKAKPGDTEAHFTFTLTNVSSSEVLINNVSTSCGCTVAKLPEQPWHIAPGGGGPIDVTVNLHGKSGLITKGVTVQSTAGIKTLIVKVNIPTPNQPVATTAPGVDMDRMRNMQMTLADRQIVFKNQECAKCHAEPAHSQSGEPIYGAALYQGVCAVCHDSPHRASMVPDLHTLNHPTNADHWKAWITKGRAGSMMPAFSKDEGGPLSDKQVSSLVEYLSKAIPSNPAAASATPQPASQPGSSANAGPASGTVSVVPPTKAN